MAIRTVEKDGVRATVDETSPGLFGKLGYTYVDDFEPSPQVVKAIEDSRTMTDEQIASFTPDPRFTSPEEAATIKQAQQTVFPSYFDEGQGNEVTDPVNLDFTPPEDATGMPQEPKGHLAEFSKLLGDIVEASRQKREGFMEKFIPGQVPLGSMSATSFTGIMNKMSRSSSQYSRDLAGMAFKTAESEADRDQRNFELKLARYYKEQDEITDIMKTAAENGANNAILNAITKSGSISGAIAIANDYLTKKNQQLVTNSKTGEVRLIATDNQNNILTNKVIIPGTASANTYTLGPNDIRYNEDGTIAATGAKVDEQGNPKGPDEDTIKAQSMAEMDNYILAAKGKWGRNTMEAELRDLNLKGVIDVSPGDITAALDKHGIKYNSAELTDTDMQELADFYYNEQNTLGWQSSSLKKERAILVVQTVGTIEDDDGKTYILTEDQKQTIISKINAI